MPKFKNLILKNIKNIEITTSGEALWASVCLIPFLDGQFDEAELDLLRTTLPKYLGQMREVGRSQIIDEHYRPFYGLNESDWPDLFKFVSHQWDLAEKNDAGDVTLMSINLTRDEQLEALQKLFDQVQKSYNELMNNIIIPLAKRDGTGVSDRGIGTLPESATEYFKFYVDTFVGFVSRFFETDRDRRDLFLAAVMAMMFVDGDNIGLEQYFLFSVWNSFGFDAETLKSGQWKYAIGIERFHNLDIPTVLPA